jgi:hypothetical protein
VTAYVPPVSADEHTQFILASASLKTARELLAAESVEGALWSYLKARRYGAPITRPDAPLPEMEPLRQAAAATVSGDASLVCRVTQQAAMLLEDAEVPEDRLRLAATLLHDLVPEYTRLLAAAPARPEPAVARAAAPRVKVTLVRWPYT